MDEQKIDPPETDEDFLARMQRGGYMDSDISVRNPEDILKTEDYLEKTRALKERWKKVIETADPKDAPGIQERLKDLLEQLKRDKQYKDKSFSAATIAGTVMMDTSHLSAEGQSKVGYTAIDTPDHDIERFIEQEEAQLGITPPSSQ